MKLQSRFFFLSSILSSFILFSCSSIDKNAEKKLIESLLDDWHKAASIADEEVFFGSMTEDCIYLGTDESEKWKRDELRQWSKEYFDRESAWSFTSYEREIYFSKDGKIAWFDEKLQTWMGPCRGSGVLIKKEDSWMIRHYNLAVLVPNDKIEKFKELVGAN